MAIINMTEPNIVYTEWAVANVFKDGTIELHKDLALPEYQTLRRKILNHELDHDFKKGFWHNFKVDFFHMVGFGGLLQFMFKRPKTWVQILPIYYTKERGIVYDKNQILFYTIIGLGILAAIKLLSGGL